LLSLCLEDDARAGVVPDVGNFYQLRYNKIVWFHAALWAMGHQLSKEDLDKACWPVFQRLMVELGERYANWIVFIEPESGSYFLGQDDYEVLDRARKRYPSGQFFGYRLSDDPVIDRF
jgi:hypothetical protein